MAETVSSRTNAEMATILSGSEKFSFFFFWAGETWCWSRCRPGSWSTSPPTTGSCSPSMQNSGRNSNAALGHHHARVSLSLALWFISPSFHHVPKLVGKASRQYPLFCTHLFVTFSRTLVCFHPKNSLDYFFMKKIKLDNLNKSSDVDPDTHDGRQLGYGSASLNKSIKKREMLQ